MKKLDDSNFTLYAASNYIQDIYDADEFYDDLSRFKYIKKLMYRYYENDDLKERLILNHLITLYNVFKHEANTRMLFYRVDKKHWHILKTFLVFLEYMPDYIYDKDNRLISSNDIMIDINVAQALRRI